MIDRRRLVAPRMHLGVLIEPDPIECLLREDEGARLSSDVAILDTTLSALRRTLRERVAPRTPIILTGHQAEFFHAGVFAKTIAADTLARSAGGSAAFLVVDSDTPKSDRLLVPQFSSGEARRIEVALPGCDPRLAAEWQPAMPLEHWLQFFTRVASLLEDYDESLLRDFAEAWLGPPMERDLGTKLSFCDALARGCRGVERAMGLGRVEELRVSRLCGAPEFRVFLAHLMRESRRFASDYNTAHAEYRRRHRVRSPQRPAPPLRIETDRVETPFWIERCGQARRRLFVSYSNGMTALFADDEFVASLNSEWLARAENHAEDWSALGDGWVIRPRALALSAFARLCVADLFIHGIGGAKYDEMMEDFARRFFGSAPLAPMACVTATAYLRSPPSSDERGALNGDLAEAIASARRASRDVRYNPQRYVHGAPENVLAERDQLIRRSLSLRTDSPGDRVARRTVFGEIRRVNERVLASDPWRASQLDQQIDVLEQQNRAAQVAGDREYFFALHGRRTLAALTEQIAAKLQAQHAAGSSR